jgi:bifunctional non-homologous end joining protein LigD
MKSSLTATALWRSVGGSETRVLSRNQKDLGKKFTKIRDSIAALDVQDVVIDGEIVALDDKGRPSFQLLQGFDMGLVRPPIVFYAFDLLRLNGEDLRSWPIEERKAKLAALLKRPPTDIRYSASFTQNIDELLSRVRELSLEGLIGKRAGSKYDSKRSGAWIKIKLYQQGFIRDRRLYPTRWRAEAHGRIAGWRLSRRKA